MRRLLLAVMALALSLTADDGTRLRVQITHTDKLNLSAGGTIRINDSLGDVNVEGWERPDVEITVTKTTEYSVGPKERDAASKLLNLFQVTAQNTSRPHRVPWAQPST